MNDDSSDPNQIILLMRQKVKTFFTQEVVLHKWAPLNWVFVRRCIEKALELDHSLTGPFLRELFDEVTQPGTGFAAMDVGYAFDSLIWVSKLSFEIRFSVEHNKFKLTLFNLSRI